MADLGDGMAERARPLGVTVLAVLAGIGCVAAIAVTLAATDGGGVVQGGALALVVASLVIVLLGVTAYGLWEMTWWAWPLALLSWISAGAQALVGLTSGMLSTGLVVAPIAIVYLLRHDIRSVFGLRVTSPSRRFVGVTAILGLVLAVLPIAGAAAAGWSPAVPNDAGTTLVARIDAAPLASPATGTSGSEEATPVEGECLDRDERPAGWLDLCWSVIRLTDEDASGTTTASRRAARSGRTPPSRGRRPGPGFDGWCSATGCSPRSWTACRRSSPRASRKGARRTTWGGCSAREGPRSRVMGKRSAAPTSSSTR